MGPLTASAILLLAVWDVLLLGRVASRWVGSESATLASFLLATILVVARHRGERVAVRRSLCAAGLGVIVGWTTYPVWVASISVVGLALGLAPRDRDDPHAMGVAVIVATWLLAPVFEEILYRGHLLPVLRDRAGAPLAIVVTSILFALPHLEAWSVLGTFLVGLALGVTRALAGSLALCIGIHAGLNLASVAWGRG
jgi:membrane protease YdiL (CAAX protease family)